MEHKYANAHVLETDQEHLIFTFVEDDESASLTRRVVLENIFVFEWTKKRKNFSAVVSPN